MTWINANDRIPAGIANNESVSVLTHTIEDQYRVAYYDFGELCWFVEYPNKIEVVQVTHWMYIPIAPKQDQDLLVPPGYHNK